MHQPSFIRGHKWHAYFLWGCTCGTMVDAAASKPTSVCVTGEAENMQVTCFGGGCSV